MTPSELKNSILQLAIQGKLVPQLPDEGTGDELYRKIQSEKQALIKAGKIKKEKPLPEISDDEKPFDIPESWRWVRTENVISLLSGQDLPPTKYNSVNQGIPYITGASNFAKDDLIINRWTPNAQAIAHAGDLLLTCKGTVGKTFILNISEVHIARQIMALTPIIIDTDFLKYFIESQIKSLQSMAKSMIPGIERANILNLPLPLPPLAEQKRIVAKIEELLPLVDRYAEAWNRLEALNKRFPDDLKKSLFQLAIQGKLVPQLPDEGTGEELYRKIQSEKQALIKAGKIKKEKPLPEISDDEKPFDIPESWAWVRLGEISTYSHTKEKISANQITNSMWCLDLEDIEKDTGKILNICLASERKIAGDKVKFYKGQILYSKLRPYLKKILTATGDGICSSEIVPFSTYGNIDSDFMVNYLKSPYVDFTINSVTYGVKMPRVGTDTMINLLVPLPPLAEQKRIVAKLEEILPLCERLK